MFIFMRWIFYWIDNIVKPLLLSSFLYVILGVWLLLAGGVTMLFFAYIDRVRLCNLCKPIIFAFIQNAIVVIIVLTILYSLFMLAVGQAGISDLFCDQVYVVSKILFWGQRLYMLLITPLFLVGTTVLSIRSISEIAYQLQDNKKWLIYIGLMTMVAVVCYRIYMILGYV